MNGRHAGKCPHRQIAGLSIVELMVALTIGLILLLALTRLFVISRSTYTLEESLARVQESGRFAMEFLAQDIRMAGYAGCSANLSGTQVGNLVDPPASPTTFNPDGLSAYKYTCSSSCSGALTEWDPDLPSDYFPSGSSEIQPIAGSDVIIIQRADTLSTHLTGNATPSNANIQIINTTELAGNISVGDILMVSDCKAADIIKVNSASSGSGKKTVTHIYNPTNNKLTHSYGNDAEIMKLISRVYFVGRRSNSTSNPPSLYRREIGNGGNLVAQELVEGVNVMRFAYGEDTTGDKVPDIYRNPSSVGNWRKVMSVRVGLLVATTSNVDQEADTRTYDLAGNAAGPYNDKQRRRAFNSTVQVRNHF
ncbi:MAG: hypothetical protein EPN55_06425 [Gammaproteobacteria bacterium]|nr:MAG: hypothetical protein EPN55_06425 [Gammaproteobacteria bacterium]